MGSVGEHGSCRPNWSIAPRRTATGCNRYTNQTVDERFHSRPMSPFSKGTADIAKVLGATRWRILGELCRHHHTASELADVVQTSANAVRVHLDALEAAGLVVFDVERRGVGKPTHVYSLTDAAESLLSKAYAPALAAIVVAARARLNGGFLSLVRDAGNALAASAGTRLSGQGLERAKALLDGLGAPSEIIKSERETVVRAACCPLGVITRQTAEMCSMMEAAVSAASGMSVRERCERGDHPHCEFELVSPVRNGSTVHTSAETPSHSADSE
jgi:predicted ArsR family transcriptional regulator